MKRNLETWHCWIKKADGEYGNAKLWKSHTIQAGAIETLEQGVKHVQVNNKDTRTMPYTISSVCVVNYEHVIASWDRA